MARRTTTRTGTGSEIVVVQAGPPARRSSGGGIRRRRSGGGSRRRRARSSGGGGGSANISTRIQNVALGGLAYGLAVKSFPQIPNIPVLGRSCSVSLPIYFLKPNFSLIQYIVIAAAAIAGASFCDTG